MRSTHPCANPQCLQPTPMASVYCIVCLERHASEPVRESFAVARITRKTCAECDEPIVPGPAIRREVPAGATWAHYMRYRSDFFHLDCAAPMHEADETVEISREEA